MKLKKQLFYVFLLLFAIAAESSFSQVKVRYGMTFSGGIGNISNVKYDNSEKNLQELLGRGGGNPDYVNEDIDYKFNIAIGYKFRILPEVKPYFYDIDINVGMKRANYDVSIYKYVPEDSVYKGAGYSGQLIYYYSSLNLSFNYKIHKGLYAGLGIEPAVYYRDGSGGIKFDIPILSRIGYDFKLIDLSLNHKFGILNPMQSGIFKSGRVSDWQLSLFIPF